MRGPTARVSGLVGEPTHETEKSFRRDGDSSAARTTKSACTHCWALIELKIYYRELVILVKLK